MSTTMTPAIRKPADKRRGVDPWAPSPDRQTRLLRGYLHKTSNVLCGIKGYASLIATEGETTKVTTRWARRILAEVEQMELIYRSVSEMAFPSPDCPRGDDLLTVVASSCELARKRHGNLAVSLEMPISGRLLLPARDLQLVLTELLANSAESRAVGAQASPIRAIIETRLGAQGNTVLLVRDDGDGMAPELLDEIAHPFVTTKTGHLGIGLARVDTIMDMYGLIWRLESRLGWGTCLFLEVAKQ